MFVCPECGRPYRDGGYCGEDGAVLVEPADPLLGTMVQRWQLARVLGAGGMGRVYLGVQPDIGSRVAIKVLSEDCARDPGLVERFFSEARAVNLIRHEHIVGVLDLARFADGRPYIVMEFIDGVTLGALARESMLPLGPLCALIDEVLSALAAAHAIGIVHRDLKPDNVLVTRAGHAKVLDFGIAKLAPSIAHAPSPRTRTGALLGTPEYMAPEQVSGKSVDGRTDLYAAGIMLYETTTGRRPFHGENLFDLLRSHLEDAPVPPRQLRPELPAPLEAVILRALEKAPDARYQTAAEMMDALAKAAGALPQSAWSPLPHVVLTPGAAPTPQQKGSRPGRPMTPAPRMSRAANTDPTPERPRSRVPLYVAGAVVLAVGGIAAGLVLGAKNKEPAPEVAAASGSGSGMGSATPLDFGSGSAAPVTVPVPVEPSPVVTPTRAQPDEESKSAPKRGRSPGGGGGSGSAAPPTADTTSPPPTTDPPPPTATTGGNVQISGNVVTSGNVGTDPNGSHVIFQKKSIHFQRKADYNPKNLDALGYADKAKALAQEIFKDAILIAVEVDGVYPDGHANLALDSDYEASFTFRSPAESKRPADVPKNVEVDIYCIVNVELMSGGIQVYTSSRETCNQRAVKPKCSLKEAWQKAIDIGAPHDDVVAEIEFDSDGWNFEIGDFDETVPDDCP
jgi:serine/threonine-protein kinase